MFSPDPISFSAKNNNQLKHPVFICEGVSWFFEITDRFVMDDVCLIWAPHPLVALLVAVRSPLMV